MAKILIVEDDKDIAMLLQTVIENSGHLVMTASTGKMAFDWLANSKPDLILLDIGLPDINGIEICEKIKTDRQTRAIPVIILTTRNDNQAKMSANLNAHADLFLNKPIDNKDLISAIKTLLEKSSADNELRRNLFRRNRPI